MTDGGISFRPGEEEAAVPVLGLAPEPPGLEPGLQPDFEPGFELEADHGGEDEPGPDLAPGPDAVPGTTAVPGTVLATRRQAALTPAPRPAGPRAMSPVRLPARDWGRKEASPGYVQPETPTDVKIVVGALMVVTIVAAIMVGLLVSSAIAAAIAAVLGVLAIVVFRWLSSL